MQSPGKGDARKKENTQGISLGVEEEGSPRGVKKGDCSFSEGLSHFILASGPRGGS